MRPYTDGPIGPLSYRHSSGVVRNLGSTAGESSTLTTRLHMLYKTTINNTINVQTIRGTIHRDSAFRPSSRRTSSLRQNDRHGQTSIKSSFCRNMSAKQVLGFECHNYILA